MDKESKNVKESQHHLNEALNAFGREVSQTNEIRLLASLIYTMMHRGKRKRSFKGRTKFELIEFVEKGKLTFSQAAALISLTLRGSPEEGKPATTPEVMEQALAIALQESGLQAEEQEGESDGEESA